MTVSSDEIISELRSHANPDNVQGMSRYGINPHNTLGVSMPVVRELGKRVGKNHILAVELWASGIHEARILAGLVDDPKQVTEQQMERWVLDFDSWDVCDQVCSNLFDRTPFAYKKALEWSEREEEYVKRAGFVLMAALATHDKKAPDEKFLPFFEIILREANDDRNFVKKAVNWALRGLGKRSKFLNQHALSTAQKMTEIDSKAARWNAADTLRELNSEKVQARLK